MNYELTFAEFQREQMDFLHRRNLNTTIDSQAEKLGEETQEMMEALATLQSDYTTENEKLFALEIVDVIIVSMGLLGEMGFDTARAILDKFGTNATKYELTDVLLLQQQGYSPVESMRIMKEAWNDKSP
jgi:NTP pyrophosphatase (non-canonical NTP hydrolase)